jgi:hypothetical protein
MSWDSLTLLRDPALRNPSKGASNRQRTRSLFSDIAALTLFKSTTTFWRGHSNVDYRLTPSIARNNLDHASGIGDLLAEARSSAHMWRDGMTFRGASDLELLALLQHTGTATPLLDLTTDPLVALYFAAQPSQMDGPTIYQRKHGLLVGFSSDRSWEDVTASHESYDDLIDRLRHDKKVGWLAPPVVADRVIVQRSRFLVAPVIDGNHWARSISDIRLNPELPIDWSVARLAALFSDGGAGRRSMPAAVAFRVPRDLKPYLLEVLSGSYGIDDRSMFPDAAGFARRSS